MKNTFILAGNGSYANRGCEAITRGTVEILNHFFDAPKYIANSFFIDDEAFHSQVKDETDASILHTKAIMTYKRFDKAWFLRQRLKFFQPNRLRTFHYEEMIPYIKDARAVFSIGGDNYSLDYGKPINFIDLDNVVLDRKKPMIIWGASIGPFSKEPEFEKYMSEHLQKVTAIFVRESHTVKYLRGIGVSNNVYRIADPAFLMKPMEPSKEKLNFKIDENSIGINLSPLMAKYIDSKDMTKWIELSAKIIRSVAKKLDCTIYLIPHVTIKGNDDHEFLKNVLEKIGIIDQRIVLVPPYFNAAEIKWVISKMAVFAGARTHATIAALSTSVPTLSFAYSIKARGINEDIYGHLNYCLEPKMLIPEYIADKIETLFDKREDIRMQLNQKIPLVKEKALSAGKILKQIISDDD